MYRPCSNPRVIFCTGGDQGDVMFESLRPLEDKIKLLVTTVVVSVRRDAEPKNEFPWLTNQGHGPKLHALTATLTHLISLTRGQYAIRKSNTWGNLSEI
jgi:hypothetical protein